MEMLPLHLLGQPAGLRARWNARGTPEVDGPIFFIFLSIAEYSGDLSPLYAPP